MNRKKQNQHNIKIMKKLLLLVAGLLFSILPSSAQTAIADITSTVAKSINDLTSGYYIINCNVPRTSSDASTKPSGSLYYNSSRLDRPFDVADGFITEGQSQLNEDKSAYVWYVEKDESGLLKIRNVSSDIYLPIDAARNNNMSNPNTKETATFVGVDKTMTDALNRSLTGIVLKYSDESVSNAPWTVFANQESGKEPNLSYWTTGDGEIMFQFVKLDNVDLSIKFPFKFSEAPSNGQFAENTHWYYLKLNGRYLAYNDSEENYSNKTQKFIYSYTANPISYGSFWAFVEDGDDIKIYNAATGTSMVLSSEGSDERTHYPSMQTDGTDGFIQSWHYTKTNTSDASKFYLFLQGTTYESGFNKLNCYGNANEGNPNNYLTFSTGAGDWSYLTVESVDINTTINSVRTAQEGITGYVGALTNNSYNSFNTALNKGNMEALIEALKIKDLTGETIQLEENKLYRLQNVMRGGILQINSDKQLIKQDAINESNASELWKIISTDNGVELFNVNAQLSANGTNNATVTEEGSVYTKKDWGSAQFSFILNDNYLVQYGGGSIGGWSSANKDGDGAWYIRPAEDIDVNITAAGYATVNYPFAVQVPSEVTAYTGTADATKRVFTLNKIEDGIIPANTPVVLEGAEGTHTLTILAENNDPALESGLEGTLLSETIEGSTNAYILGQKEESKPGFYQMDGTDRTLAANKAYLVLPATASAVRSIVFSDGTTTGIKNTVAEGGEAEEYYDLQGRRVMNPTKGIYVTKSGKKVLINK